MRATHRAAAEPLFHDALEAQHETLSSQHPSTLVSISNLGLLMHAENG